MSSNPQLSSPIEEQTMMHDRSSSIERTYGHDEKLEEQLDEIIRHLRRIDRRDKWRMVGSVFHFALIFVPLIITLFITWYSVTHVEDIMKSIVQYTSQSVLEQTQSGGANVVNTLREQLKNLGIDLPTSKNDEKQMQ